MSHFHKLLPINSRRALLRTFLYDTAQVLHNFLNVLVQITYKMGFREWDFGRAQ
jgi:hypothetical protein